MTHEEINETLFDNSIRFESVIYLAGALAQSDSLPDDLCELLDVETDETVSEAFPGFPLSLRDDGDCFLEFAAEWLIDNRRLGFLVKVATPVMTPVKGSSSLSFSWGRYRTKWIYADTMDGVVCEAVKWADGLRESEKESK